MKRGFSLFLIGILLISLTACRTKTDDSTYNPDKSTPTDHMTTACSKDSVDEFMDIIGEVELGGLSAGMKLDEEHCYNVTPLSVATQTDIKIFKFSDSCV